jgi:hypothetical protein
MTPRAGIHFQLLRSRLLALTVGALALGACSDGPTAPVAGSSPASVRWNMLARELVIRDGSAPPFAARAYAYVSVAQFASALAARGLGTGAIPSLATLRDAYTPAAAAIASASAHILASLFPLQASRIDEALRSDLAALARRGVTRDGIERGETLGAAIAASLLARAESDGWNADWTGSLPNGDGLWSGTNPQLPMWGFVQPWLWGAGSEMRVAPPPAFNSQEFRDALTEVRQISATRTPAQMEIARLWADGAGTYTPPGHWNEIASDLILENEMSDLQAARTLALMNVAMSDAFIGCWDSKFFYWVIRPWQADPTITTPIGQPPHPSYPSGHACTSSAGAAVLAALFPSEGAELHRMAVEACDSRVYGGIHYRFDAEAGMEIGNSAAQRALERGDELVRSQIERAFVRMND